MFDKVINLMKEKVLKDEIAQSISSFEKREVFAFKKSISQKEFNTIKNNSPFVGLRKANCFLINIFDYDDEEFLEYNNEVYKIYRLYERGDIIEIYCEIRGGLNGN